MRIGSPKIEARIAAIEEREELRGPARTTIVNTVQLISRALKHASETIDGVPDVGGVSMPRSSPGRERRLREGEEQALLAAAAEVDPVMPLLVRFAIATTLRRERLLQVTPGHLVGVGRGRLSIVFPRDERVSNKRTGIVPATVELQGIMDEVRRLKDVEALDPGRPLFDVSKSTLTSWWGRATQDAGIDDLHFHDLRHEGTSRLFERGLSMIEVMSITGHSTTEMLDRYSHYSSAIVGEKLDQVLDTGWMLREIELLVDQFRAAGGQQSDLERLSELLGAGRPSRRGSTRHRRHRAPDARGRSAAHRHGPAGRNSDPTARPPVGVHPSCPGSPRRHVSETPDGPRRRRSRRPIERNCGAHRTLPARIARAGAAPSAVAPSRPRRILKKRVHRPSP